MTHPKNWSASEMRFASNGRVIEANKLPASSRVFCSPTHLSQMGCGHFEPRAESGSMGTAVVQCGRTARAMLVLFAVASSFASGNTKGALGRYGPPPELTHCAVTIPHGFLVIRRNPLDPETLRRLYPGGKSEYLARFTTRLNQLVQQRWLVQADADVEREMAETNAASAFGH